MWVWFMGTGVLLGLGFTLNMKLENKMAQRILYANFFKNEAKLKWKTFMISLDLYRLLTFMYSFGMANISHL